jgi:phosphatidylserine decarboxylase
LAGERHSLFDTIADSIVPVHSDGFKFLAIAAAVTLFFFWFWPPLAWVAVIVTAWIAYFFRDPPRVTPLREGLVVAPGDGRISAIERVTPPIELGLGDTPRVRISIFLSVFDVHIQRTPIAGRVARVVYTPGTFLNAALDKASEDNERCSTVLTAADGTEIAVVQIAGLIARRIVCTKDLGDAVQKGERFGLIKFGSRTDLDLGPEWEILVRPGERVRGGSSILARMRP